MNTRATAAILLAGTMLLAGCHRAGPAGQVAATVNGKEVTLQEMNTELQSTSFPPDADKQLVQRALLQRVIDRKLLVGAAEEKKLDKTPEYLAQKRRMDEILLAQAYAKQQLASVPVPSEAEIEKYMADHPAAYAKRETLALDQIRFAPPANPKPLDALTQDHTLDAIAARLTSLGIAFQRGKTSLDTANVPQPVLAKIDALPAGEPFIIPQPGVFTVNVLTGRAPVPIDASAAKQSATRTWREEKFGGLLQSQLDNLKAGAKIHYQNGYGPPPANAPKGKDTAATPPTP